MQKNMGKSSCEPTDIACLCTDEEFSALTQACLAQSCVVKDMLSALASISAA